MWPLIRDSFRSFLFDREAAKRWLRGFLLWAGGMATSVLAYPYDEVTTWGVREWTYRLAAAAALGFAGAIGVGQKNPTSEELKAMMVENGAQK